jgi:hypothetical protein
MIDYPILHLNEDHKLTGSTLEGVEHNCTL